MRPRAEAAALAERYVLSLRLPPAHGPAGMHKGRGTGSSTEFQDHRNYQPGDDVRHLDWRAYARSDQLLLKRYREEIRPSLDLLIDASASMATDPDKAQRAVDLAALFARSAAAEGFHVRIRALGDREERISVERLLREGVDFKGVRPLGEAVGALETSSGGLFVLVSDFLVPDGPERWLRGVRAGRVALVQVLSTFDDRPPEGGAVRLRDAETGGEVDVVLDRPTVERYLERLERLGATLAEEARRRGGVHLRLVADEDLDSSCRRLVEVGILGVV
ncbi:MAG TPA: DUF58 domain-containing protein [Myxococcota bacterium]|nr:DUF58 domain-containing protein [Myxococcota bacterium]